MFLPEIIFHQPSSLNEAVRLMGTFVDQKKSYALCAGGTDLMPQLKRGSLPQQNLVAIKQLKELCFINESKDHLEIGAATSLVDLAQSELVCKWIPALSEAAKQVASVQIRNQATLGGNLMVDNRCVYVNQTELITEAHEPCFKQKGNVCHLIANAGKDGTRPCRARYVSDTGPVLILAKTQLHLLSRQGQRKVLLVDFYLNDGIDRNKLQGGELLHSLIIPKQTQRKIVYEKLRLRGTIDFPSVGVAASLVDESTLGLAVTGVDANPIHIETHLKDFSSTSEWIEKSCQKVMAMCSPLRQDILSPAYRKQMVAVLGKKLLLQLIS